MEIPDPLGEKPDDWQTEHWQAFQVLRGGGIYSEAAAEVNRGTGTISRWVRQWRDRYGDEVLPRREAHTFTEEDRKKGSEVLRVKQSFGIYNVEQRARESGEYAATAALVREAIEASLVKYLAQDYTPTMREIRDMGELLKVLSTRAEALAGGGGLIHSDSMEPDAGGVDLSALEIDPDDAEMMELFEIADELAEFEERRRGNAIEVEVVE